MRQHAPKAPRFLPAFLLSLGSAWHAAPALAQDAAFVALFPDDSLDGWTFENAPPESFSLRDGVLRVSGEGGWLRSPREYADFALRAEVRFVEPDSDSGIFLRAGTGTPFILGWPGDAYQVQMRDISVNPGDSPLPLAQLYRHRIADGPTDYARERVFALYTGPGEWQQVEIRAQGETLEVRLNGEIVTRASGLVNASGHLGFQSEAGVIEYRQLQIAELPANEA